MANIKRIYAQEPEEKIKKLFVAVSDNNTDAGTKAKLVAQAETLQDKVERLEAKMAVLAEKLAKNHYAEHVEKPFFGELVSYITSAPVVAMVWQGDDCVNLVRKLVGSTKPSEAAPGTIRGDFCLHSANLVLELV